MRYSRVQVCVVASLMYLLAVFLAACNPKIESTIHRYKLKGVVVSVDLQSHYATINHEDIPGFMDAMTMAYLVKDDKAFAELAPGDQITADVVVANQQSWLENIVILKKGAPEAPKPSVQFHLPQPGEDVPNFTLVNQDGKRIRFRHYRGKAVLLTFIYTRCPLPDYCPRMTSNFEEINKALMQNQKIYAETHLLSISFDPKYDTPRVLREYGSRHIQAAGKAKFDHWEFASVTQIELKSVAKFFGLQYWEEGGQVTHSMSTALITPEGKLFKWYSGNDWKPADVVNDLTKMLQTSVEGKKA